MSEWMGASRACLPYFDRPSLVKTLWALAQLEQQPEDAWLEGFVEAAAPVLQASAFEPLELIYLTR